MMLCRLIVAMENTKPKGGALRVHRGCPRRGVEFTPLTRVDVGADDGFGALFAASGISELLLRTPEMTGMANGHVGCPLVLQFLLLLATEYSLVISSISGFPCQFRL
jgi:hypothetical protein